MIEPTIGTRAASSPSVAKTLCARGRTPRTTSVKVCARAMADLKSVTGKSYLQFDLRGRGHRWQKGHGLLLAVVC